LKDEGGRMMKKNFILHPSSLKKGGISQVVIGFPLKKGGYRGLLKTLNHYVKMAFFNDYELYNVANV
jgi:hypothetical protein